MRVLYADVLFLINFCMDFFSLYLTAKILRMRYKIYFMILACTIAGVYSVISVIYSGNGIFGYIIDFLAAFVITYVAFFGIKNLRTYMKITAVFYLTSFLLGGIITVLYRLLNEVVKSGNISEPDGVLKAIIFILLGAISAVCINISNRILHDAIKARSVSLKLTIDSKKTTVEALVDSGNFLRDPISGKQVIVVSMQAVEQMLPFDIRRIIKSDCFDVSDISPGSAKRIRLIPARGIGGTKTYIGISPDEIEVLEGNKKAYTINALIAVDRGEKYQFAGYGGVVPSTLICG
ncbi:MAG: sigma-E processing peptidase SpoIIGA [Eubacteriales bacterium]|nr:sigma-E processing peptidase SpoIIGA [Eubacteriales bacterium]